MAEPRVGFLTAHDPLDRRSFSGTIFSMYDQLRREFPSVVHLGRTELSRRRTLWRRAMKKLTGTPTLAPGPDFLTMAKRHGRMVERELRETPCDVIFAPVASRMVAFLNTDVPIAYHSDSAWAQIRNYYPEFQKVPAEEGAQREEVERRAIRRADPLIYSSRWVVESALNDYGADPERIRVIPYGANMREEEVPPAEEVLNSERVRDPVCRLLYMAKSGWLRKGGDIALETLAELNRQGVPAELTILGGAPPEGTHVPPGVKMTGFLNKNIPAEMERIRQILKTCHFLVLPTRADCSPIVCCEASSYALPVVATSTGGVTELVDHGVTGWLFPLEARGDAYARKIAETFGDRGTYEVMVRNARKAYEERLNWRAWGKAVAAELRELHATGRVCATSH